MDKKDNQDKMLERSKTKMNFSKTEKAGGSKSISSFKDDDFKISE